MSGKAYYIDTNNTFRPERIIQMAEGLDLNEEEILEGIFVDRAYNSDHQFRLVKSAEIIIRKYGIKLLIIDNIISHILSELTVRGTLDLRRKLLRTHLNDLLRLTAIFPELVIVYTNQVYEKPDVFYGSPLSALGGNVLAHAAHTRIYLRKGRGEERVAKVKKSPFLPDCEAVFSITDYGIM